METFEMFVYYMNKFPMPVCALWLFREQDKNKPGQVVIPGPVTQRIDEDRVLVGLQNLAIKKEAKKKQKPLGLVDLVFSWSLTDIMNKDFYKDKVCCFHFFMNFSLFQIFFCC